MREPDVLVVGEERRPEPESPSRPSGAGPLMAAALVLTLLVVATQGRHDTTVDPPTSVPVVDEPSDEAEPDPSREAPDPLALGWGRAVLSGRGPLIALSASAQGMVAMAGGPEAWWTRDGIDWAAATFADGGWPEAVTLSIAGGDTMLAVGTTANGAPLARLSVDGGRTWSQAAPPAAEVLDLAWTGSHFVGVGRTPSGAVALLSEDGVEWDVSPLPVAEDEAVAATVAVRDDEIVALGGTADGPALWRGSPDRPFARLTLEPPVGDRAWGPVDFVDVEPDDGRWLVLTRSRLGGWGRVLEVDLFADGDGLLEWRWVSAGFDARGVDLVGWIDSPVLVGPAEGLETVARPGTTGLEPVGPGLQGPMRAGVLAPGNLLVTVGGPEMPVVWYRAGDGGGPSAPPPTRRPVPAR